MALQRHMRVVDYDSDNRDQKIGLKIAFATTDMKTVNQHFGSAHSFSIYMVNPEEAVFLEAAQFANDCDTDEDKLTEKIAMLEDCSAVYCQAIGSSAIRKLVMRGVQPVKVTEGSEVNKLITALQEEMCQGPSAWLAKAISKLTRPDNMYIDKIEDDDWNE